MRLQAGGVGYFYSEQTTFNRADGSARLDSHFRFTPRTGGSLALGLDYGHTDSSSILVDQVVYLPQTRTLGFSGDAGLQHKASSQLTLRAGVRAYRMGFPDAPASSLLRDSASLRMTAGADRRLSPQNSVSLEYSAERTNFIEESTEGVPPVWWTHFQSIQWAHTFSSRTGFLLEGGASYTPRSDQGGLDRPWNFFGGASLNHRVRSSFVTAYYRREVLPAFGVVGVHFVNRVGLKASVPLGDSFSVGVIGTYGRGVQGSSSSPPQAVADAALRLVRPLGRRLQASLEGRYRRQSSPAFARDVNDYRAGFFVNLVPPRAGRTTSPSPWPIWLGW